MGVTTIELLKAHPKACERLGITLGEDNGFRIKNGSWWIRYDSPYFVPALAGAALLWLADRNAHPQWYQSLTGRNWDVVVADKSGGYILLVERADTPLEAMLEAIEKWEEQA